MSPARARQMQAAEAAKSGDLLPDFCSLPTSLGVILYGEPAGGFPVTARSAVAARAVRGADRRRPAVSVTPAAAAVRPPAGGAVDLDADRRRGTNRDAGRRLALPWAEQGGLFPDDGLHGLLMRAGLISAIVGALMLRYL